MLFHINPGRFRKIFVPAPTNYKYLCQVSLKLSCNIKLSFVSAYSRCFSLISLFLFLSSLLRSCCLGSSRNAVPPALRDEPKRRLRRRGGRGYKTKTEDLRPKNEVSLKIVLGSLQNGPNMFLART